jgi:hypothetical protein
MAPAVVIVAGLALAQTAPLIAAAPPRCGAVTRAETPSIRIRRARRVAVRGDETPKSE